MRSVALFFVTMPIFGGAFIAPPTPYSYFSVRRHQSYDRLDRMTTTTVGTTVAGPPFITTTTTTTTLRVSISDTLRKSIIIPALVFLLSTCLPRAAVALTESQSLVDGVWREVSRQYVDRTFNGLGEEGWRKKRLEAARRVADCGPDDSAKVYDEIRTMLQSLGDPYTRFLAPDQYEALTAYATGRGTAGIGVQLLLEPRTGQVVILNVVTRGPAARAGVEPGDIVLAVDGEDVSRTSTAEFVAARCRGELGTELRLSVRHAESGTVSDYTVTRAEVKPNAVSSSTFVTDNVNGNGNGNGNGKVVGLVKIPSFSQETVTQVTDALRDVGPVDVLAVDLRGNAGGYMPAGVDVAKLFLPAQTRIISEVDRGDRKTIYVSDGIGSDTSTTLYLLVDKRTASASEILTAALQDNRRATVLGSTETFGKGRIQNVQPLEDGSGISVTKAKYVSPNGRDIHGIGITPDTVTEACGPEQAARDCLRSVL